MKDVMARAPHMKELIDMYSGPDVVTAKQQEEELQRVANTLPENIPSSVKRFTDKTLLSLKVCVTTTCALYIIHSSGGSILHEFILCCGDERNMIYVSLGNFTILPSVLRFV